MITYKYSNTTIHTQSVIITFLVLFPTPVVISVLLLFFFSPLSVKQESMYLISL